MRTAPRIALLLLLPLPAACTDEVEQAPLAARWERFGIFRDLVLFQRPADDGGAFFLDRFESTRAGFAQWRGRAAADPVREPDLRPVVGIDLHTARAFAAWRFCRLPRRSEWMYACTQGGVYQFPWGNRWYQTWANTAGLGVGEPVPVGSFESGRGPGGPYDMVGNVAEWTETVAVPFPHYYSRYVVRTDLPVLPRRATPRPPAEVDGELHVQDWPVEPIVELPAGLRMWLPLHLPLPEAWLRGGDFIRRVERQDVLYDMPGVDELRRTPGLAMWLPAWLPAPTDWLVEADSGNLEREVLGGHFRSNVVVDWERRPAGGLPEPRRWQPGRWDGATGVRVAADPEGLLVALLGFAGEASEADLQTLRRFVLQDKHREVLAEAWPRALRRRPAGGVLRDLLVDLLKVRG